MLDRTAIGRLRDQISESWIVDRIADIDAAADRLPYEVFREPVSLMDVRDNGHHQAFNLNSHYLTGWSRHIAYSMRVRLRTLEPGIVAELASGRGLVAQVLLRSHLEAAVMAALCLETLQARDQDALSRLIPQTLFGTALLNKAKQDERIAEMLSYSSARTITISQAIAALYRFGYPNGGPADTSIGYALLCEAAHPNQGGTKQFVHAEDIDESGEYGWYINYANSESIPPVFTGKLSELLLFSMSCGYAATELLRCMLFMDVSSGVMNSVSEEALRNIWNNFCEKARPPVDANSA